MSPHEHRVRTIVLAQALGSADASASLPDAAARQQALRAGLRAAPSTAGALPSDIDRLHAHAQSLVQPVVVRYPALAALVQLPSLWRWLSVVVPLLALVAGMATDRISNPHRVDLLSVPLLVVVGWNLLMYTLLVAAALRGQPAGQSSAIAAVQGWARAQRPGVPAKVAMRFYSHWHRLADALTLYRWKKVLHLAAAAWGAGIALSLAGRGLFVQYQVGWESTFLNAAQVHAILEVLFWLPGKVFGLSPFTLNDVAVLRNFAVPSQAADRWVFLYAGLLGLVVVAPRLGLAAWAGWRAHSLSKTVHVNLDEAYYRCLLEALQPAQLVIGLVNSDARSDAQLLRLIRQVSDDPLAQHLAVTTAEGDTLRWLEAPMASQAVDALLRAQAGPLGHVPGQWTGRPLATLPAESAGRCWEQGPLLIESLAAQLGPSLQPGLMRLTAEWTSRRSSCFDQSMTAVAAFLVGAAAPQTAMAAARDELVLKLKALHRLDRATGDALEQKMQQRYPVPAVIAPKKPRGAAAAAAGAATGATMGGAVDMATGFLSLGAGVALGSLLGAGIGWAMSAWWPKDASGEAMTRLTEATLLLYFEFANTVRVHAAAVDAQAAWQGAITRELARHKAALTPLWLEARQADGQAATQRALAALLGATVQAAIDTLFPPLTTPATLATTSSPATTRPEL